MQKTEFIGLTAMQILIKSLEEVKKNDSDLLTTQLLQAVIDLAGNLLETEKMQIQDAYRNPDFESYFIQKYKTI